MIEAIYVSEHKKGDQIELQSVQLEKGKGIAGDRRFGQADKAGRNVTFVEIEEIESYNSRYGQEIPVNATRRNIVTRGVRLNDLVGKEFEIGDVRFRGIELCEPCDYLGQSLENKTISKQEVVRAFLHKAGLRADVLTSGSVSKGSSIVELADA